MLLKQLGEKCLLRNVSFVSKRFQSTADPSGKHFDIIVAGGGMVGTTLACTLGKNPKLSNKKILLLEGGKKSEWKLPDVYSNRVSSLNPATYELLNDIGAWKHIDCARFGLMKRMKVWDALSDASISFENDDLEQPVAYVVENDVLLDAVSQETSEIDSVKVVYQAKIQNCKTVDEDENEVTVCLESGDTYTCDLLLGCDGANSLVRKAADFHHVACNYNHMGIVATLKLPEDDENVVAWQRHLPNSGFMALLPLADGLSSMVWSTNQREAKRLIKLSEDEFVDAVNEALWKVFPRSGVISQAMKTFDGLVRSCGLPSSTTTQCPPKILGCDISSRAMFPLGMGHATNYVAEGVALVGDAAHRVHPLAGQGVNLGFGDIICLNKVLGDAVRAGSTLGSLEYLKVYETERQRYNVPMMMAIHGLFQLYGTEFPPLVLLRGLGLQATHALTPLKKIIMQQASGQRNWQV